MSLNSIEYSLISSVMFIVLNEQNLLPLVNKEKCHNTWHNLSKTVLYLIYVIIYLKINKQNDIQIILLSVITFLLLSIIGSSKTKQLSLGKFDKKCPTTLSVILYSIVFGGIIYSITEKK